jgi:hypothetical protein
MATAVRRISEKRDEQIGWLVSAIALTLLIIFLILKTFEMADPPPVDFVMEAQTEIPIEIDLKNLKVETGNAGSGSPTDDPIDQPKPQQQEVLSSTKPSSTKTESGKSNKTNSTTQSNNTATTTTQSTNPFGTGGNNGNTGSGTSPFGSDTGSGGTGPGGSGGGEGRVRLNDPTFDHITTDVDVTIYLKLTVNEDGIVVAATSTAKTTTTDQRIINQVIAAVKNQVKYSKYPGAGLVTQYLTVKLNAR